MDADTQKLLALKEELRKDIEAIERVEHLMASKNGSLNRRDDRQITLPIALSNDEDIEEGSASAGSLKGTIEQFINSDPAKRWTTQKVLSNLQNAGFPLRAQKPIYSVGQALNKLAAQGKIRIARRGSGNTPNIYKGISRAGHGEQPEEVSEPQGVGVSLQ